MELTKEMVVESINTYCTERKYGSETLTDGFKEKFSNSFVKKYEGQDVEEQSVLTDLHFYLDTAFNASLDINKELTSQFTTKETDYKNQIAELNKKLGKKPKQEPFEIPKELQDQIDELKAYKNEESKKTKFKSIVDIAKKKVRSDLHNSFEKYAKTYSVSLDKDDVEQADDIVKSFQEIFKDSIGDIRPFTPKQIQQQDDDIISSVKKVEL